MGTNLDDDQKDKIWKLIQGWEDDNNIVEHNGNYPRYSVKPTDTGGYNFWCSGCNEIHHIPNVGNGSLSLASFNGNLFRSTFSRPNSRLPIFLTTISSKGFCMYSIKLGIINYSRNCPHHLAGMAVELREYKDWDTVQVKWCPQICIIPNCGDPAVKDSNLCKNH